ncbi:TIGR03618 family F420-dependent PPOX class oxidoreductase [Mycobacteroides immunogenum]|uniref:Pyridoxamine 5-phosphate oxidase n=1 Tax=Mycobacteroides immunogenum TaxID=83262 RepID=A0A7V8RYN1_9MYCO|nr:TIGR03618 family F420-dependent PPOX class oxidoreductase [Mycobacteroides immunogenum]AMT73216.1 pyridoxamine 5-phosphate oxidase [Mycobacteroides immunogenum]ANO06375.1 PPOX class F420-dependent enzyme [Mycobacteroides immunogenum]KIU37860.1 pyridoxamine 5-phosphate oxidase [Mycobacteroides immunogenum]KPG11462.1 pyridoxamine 5-phosphate oxidase [Mycobacteroides immunogenum]KPG12050.1 pyridoxamine 5-phosphate oxidase [Mycobacteroides immunogenum]
MTSIHDAAVRDFLGSDPALIGQLGYLGADGRPLILPVWYRLADDHLQFVTQLSTLKIKALQRDPRVVIAVATQTEPYRYVQVQGEAKVETDSSGVRATLIDITARYLGADRAEAYVDEHHSAPGEVIVRVNPVRVHAAL